MLLYFGLDCGMLEFFTHIIQRTINVSPIFGAQFRGKDQGCGTCKPWSKQVGGWRLDSFLHEAAPNFELFIKFQDQKLNKKPIPVDVLFRAYPMVWPDCTFNTSVWNNSSSHSRHMHLSIHYVNQPHWSSLLLYIKDIGTLSNYCKPKLLHLLLHALTVSSKKKSI